MSVKQSEGKERTWLMTKFVGIAVCEICKVGVMGHRVPDGRCPNEKSAKWRRLMERRV